MIEDIHQWPEDDQEALVEASVDDVAGWFAERVLEEIRRFPAGFSALSESAQADYIDTLGESCGEAVRMVARHIMAQRYAAVPGHLEGINIKGSMRCTVVLPLLHDASDALVAHVGRGVLLVLADESEFAVPRDLPAPDRDQGDMLDPES